MKIMDALVDQAQYALDSIRGFVESIDGIYVNYTADKFAAIIPLPESQKIQKVFGAINEDKERVEFYAMVCQKLRVDFEKLSEVQRSFTYSRFIKEEGSILLFASISLESVSYSILSEVVMEVAENAAEWEKKLKEELV